VGYHFPIPPLLVLGEAEVVVGQGFGSPVAELAGCPERGLVDTSPVSRMAADQEESEQGLGQLDDDLGGDARSGRGLPDGGQQVGPLRLQPPSAACSSWNAGPPPRQRSSARASRRFPGRTSSNACQAAAMYNPSARVSAAARSGVVRWRVACSRA